MIFNDFLETFSNDPEQFRVVLRNNLLIVEDVAENNIFIYNINVEDGKLTLWEN